MIFLDIDNFLQSAQRLFNVISLLRDNQDTVDLDVYSQRHTKAINNLASWRRQDFDVNPVFVREHFIAFALSDLQPCKPYTKDYKTKELQTTNKKGSAGKKFFAILVMVHGYTTYLTHRAVMVLNIGQSLM